MDAQVGRILDELDALGLRDSTAIVFTSDHGYHLGEHTFWEKGNLHEEVTRVPLLVSLPGMKGAESSQIVELVDLYPTLAELAGLVIPDHVKGTSLVPVLENPGLDTPVKVGALSFAGKGTSLRVPGWHYASYGKNGEELYDMAKDPGQFDNLAHSQPGHPKLPEFRKLLKQRLQSIK